MAELLYKSASEHGYIDPDKVEEILEVAIIMANDGILILQQENIWLLLNPVIFKFCLWLLYSAEKYFVHENRQDIIPQLQDYATSHE